MAGQSAPESGRVVVPNLITDPVWSLRLWPVSVTVGGFLAEIPAMPAVDWLTLLMPEDLELEDILLTHIDPDTAAAITDAMFDGHLELEQVHDTCLDILSAVCGRPWWAVLRLVGMAAGSWHILGPQMLSKVDAERISIAGWLDVLLMVILENLDPKDITMFTMKLEMPPPNVEVEPASMEMSASAFMSMA